MLIGVFRLIDDVQLLKILKKTCAETHAGMRESKTETQKKR